MDCKNLLIIEDDVDTREALKEILEIQGYRVFTASDGAEGISLLRSMSPLPCLVLLDLMMPNTNGWQFLDIQRNDPLLSKVPVAVCSAYIESAKAVRPSAVIPKPIQFHDLIDTVKTFSA